MDFKGDSSENKSAALAMVSQKKAKKVVKKKTKFMVSTSEANHVAPLLEKLIE